MTDESAFLAALRDDPLDGATRAVYCDWLEERGDPRAEYLRQEIELAAVPLNDARWSGLAGWVRDHVDAHDPDWVAATCPRYDVWLQGLSDPARKIALIKETREAAGCGLADAARLVEYVPSRVLAGVVFPAALMTVGKLLKGLGPDAGWPHVSLWPARAPRAGERPWDGWPARLLPVWRYAVLLGEPKRDKEEAVAHAIRDLTGMGLPEAAEYARAAKPVRLTTHRTREQAAAAAQRFLGLADVTVEERPHSGPAFTVPLGLWQGHRLERPG